jgi:hypothetical protein
MGNVKHYRPQLKSGQSWTEEGTGHKEKNIHISIAVHYKDKEEEEVG